VLGGVGDLKGCDKRFINEWVWWIRLDKVVHRLNLFYKFFYCSVYFLQTFVVLSY
jgi:hypothetical protein